MTRVRQWAAPLLILSLAIVLRLHRLGDVHHDIDQAYPVYQAITLWQTGHWPGLGQNTSVLVANPAGMSYLMLIPWALFQTTWGAHIFVILLNLLTIPLIYQTVRAVGTLPQAEVAALLAATSPWLNRYSYGTWVQGLVPLWVTLVFALLVRASVGRAALRPRRWFSALVALAALTQMYLLAFLNVAQVAAVALAQWRKISWRGVWAGGAVLVLTTGLFVQQLWVHWPEQSARIARFGEVASQPLAARWTALEHAVRYVTGRDYEMIYGRDDSAEWQLRRLLSLCLSLALSVALGMGVARAIYRVVARAPDAAYWLMVLAWWSIPVAALTVTRHPAHIVYLLLTVPAGFMLAAPLLAPLTRYRLGQILLVAWVFNCFWLIRADRAAVAARPVGEGLDRLSLNALPRFQSTVTQLVTEHHTAEMYVSLDEASLTAKAGRALKAISWSDVPTMTLFLLEQSAIYARGEGSEALPPIPLARREAKLDEAGGDAIVFDVIPAYTRAELAGLPQHRVDWPTEQGVTLIGYDVEPDDSRLTTYWLVETLADARGLWLYAPYAHVINEAGQIIANVGGPGLPGYYYRANEVYVTRITLPELPAGVYQLEVGLYDGVHGFGVTFMPPGAPPQPAYTAPLTWP